MSAGPGRPPRGLAPLLAVTDVGFIVYWSVTGLAAAGVVQIPAAYLYKGYHDPMLVAWNWSFAPLDLAASFFGLAALAALRAGRAWRGLAIASLAFTSVAGGMAIAFWALSGDFDLGWWAPNLVLFAWPWLYLPSLMRDA
ncbi:MAG: DUF5360 family protein [Caulobacterales bacterium]|jgi:hypothetical protein